MIVKPEAYCVMPRALRWFASAFVLGLGLAVGACSDGDDSQSTTASTPAGNQAPTISGSPTGQAVQGQTYSFSPSAADANSDVLTFSISNKPGWLTFDATTGRVSGTPTAADVGMYSNITISVSDGTAATTLRPFSIQVVGTATGSVTLSWTPPTQNTDSSALTNLAGYRVYWSTTPGSYANSTTVNNPGISSYVVEQLTPATWYFAVTAINTAGVESVFSNAASKTL